MHIDALDLYAIVVECLGDALLVALLLLLVDTVGAHVHVGQQVECGKTIVTVFACWVVGVAHLVGRLDIIHDRRVAVLLRLLDLRLRLTIGFYFVPVTACRLLFFIARGGHQRVCRFFRLSF